jgi:hypothetical protein
MSNHSLSPSKQRQIIYNGLQKSSKKLVEIGKVTKMIMWSPSVSKVLVVSKVDEYLLEKEISDNTKRKKKRALLADGDKCARFARTRQTTTHGLSARFARPSALCADFDK